MQEIFREWHLCLFLFRLLFVLMMFFHVKMKPHDHILISLPIILSLLLIRIQKIICKHFEEERSFCPIVTKGCLPLVLLQCKKVNHLYFYHLIFLKFRTKKRQKVVKFNFNSSSNRKHANHKIDINYNSSKEFARKIECSKKIYNQIYR